MLRPTSAGSSGKGTLQQAITIEQAPPCKAEKGPAERIWGRVAWSTVSPSKLQSGDLWGGVYSAWRRGIE